MRQKSKNCKFIRSVDVFDHPILSLHDYFDTYVPNKCYTGNAKRKRRINQFSLALYFAIDIYSNVLLHIYDPPWTEASIKPRRNMVITLKITEMIIWPNPYL